MPQRCLQTLHSLALGLLCDIIVIHISSGNLGTLSKYSLETMGLSAADGFVASEEKTSELKIEKIIKARKTLFPIDLYFNGIKIIVILLIEIIDRTHNLENSPSPLDTIPF